MEAAISPAAWPWRQRFGKFQECNPDMAAKAILREIFFAANIALYDSEANDRKATRMATTMNVCIFKGRDVHIGHVGDSRLYLVRQEEIKKLTNDHSMTGLQLKLRLMTEMEARASHLRSMLTRSVGARDHHPISITSASPSMQHDRFLQCTDGLYCFMNDGEIAEGVDRLNLDEICPYLVNLAERRGTDDNLTAQLIHVDRVTPLKKEKPLSILTAAGKTVEVTDQNELTPGQLVDDRYRIDAKISRSGMATIYKAFDTKENHPVALKIPHMQYESDVGFFSRFQREADIGRDPQSSEYPEVLRAGPESKPALHRHGIARGPHARPGPERGETLPRRRRAANRARASPTLWPTCTRKGSSIATSSRRTS